MTIQTEHTIDYVAKTVTHTSGTTVYTMLKYFQYLAAEFAVSAQMDDDYPMESLTTRDFKWINGWSFGSEVNDIKFLNGGGIVSSDTLDTWSTVYSIGSAVAGTQFYIMQNSTEIVPWWSVDAIDVMIKIRSAGTYIDSGVIRVMARELSDTFDHFEVDMTSSGYNPASINTEDDGNNQTASGTIAAYGITYTFGIVSRNLNNGAGLKDYDLEIDCNGKTMLEAYEHSKYAGQHDSIITLNGDAGEEYLSAQVSYLQIKKAPLGTFAGGKFFAARGVWFTNYNGADFELIAADGTPQLPPSLQGAAVSHASLSGTTILIAETDGGNAIIKNQYTLSSLTVNTITMTLDINPNKSPQNGIVRFGDTEYAYTGFSGAILSGVTPDPSGESGDAYIPILSVVADAISEVSAPLIYNTDFTVKSVVRKYGFKQFSQDGVFGVNGLSVTPVLSVDPQAT